tara:strand:- start:185 stop:445 length:261 start_codon:yes stop_codon:yes gene_type:complete
MKINKTISIDNILTLAVIICGAILALGFMQYDIDMIKENLDLKANKREIIADRNLITYKLDVITSEIEEMKISLKEIKGELHGFHK